MKKILDSIVSGLIETGTIEKSEAEIYFFGLYEGVMLIFNVILTLAISWIISDLKTGILFLLCFIAVRRYAGGFHADTRGKCFAISLILVIAALTGIEMMSGIAAKVQLSMILFISMVIIWLAPVENANKPLGELEKRVYKRYVFFWLCIEDCVAILTFLTLKNDVLSIIFMAQLMVLFLTVCGIAKKVMTG